GDLRNARRKQARVARERRARRCHRTQDEGVLLRDTFEVVEARQRLVEARGAEDHLERLDAPALVQQLETPVEMALRYVRIGTSEQRRCAQRATLGAQVGELRLQRCEVRACRSELLVER